MLHRTVVMEIRLPLSNRRALLLTADRVGGAQMHSLLGPLLDQFWVH